MPTGERARNDQGYMTVTAWNGIEFIMKFTTVHYKAQMRMYTIQGESVKSTQQWRMIWVHMYLGLLGR